MPIIQYALAAFGSVVAISLASLAWPLLTAQPRPEPLTKVRDVVIQTPLGAQTAQVLGVSDESMVQPMSFGAFVTKQANTLVQTVAQGAQNAVTNQVLITLAKRFQELPPDQQTQFQAMICQPQAEPVAQ